MKNGKYTQFLIDLVVLFLSVKPVVTAQALRL